MNYLYCLAAILLCTACQEAPQMAQSEKGQFKIQFPGAFKEVNVPIQTRYGKTELQAFSYQSKDSLIQYQAAFNELPGTEALEEPDSLFKKLIMGPAMQLNPISLQRDRQDYDGHPGMRFRLLGIEAAAVYDIYLVDRNIYQLVIINREPREPTAKEIKAFMGSFELTK